MRYKKMNIDNLERIKNETKLPIIRIELAETKSSTIIYEPEVSN